MIMFESKNYLYHYTSLDCMSKIIKSGILKFGSLSRMNDITEASKEYYLDISLDNEEWDNLSLLEKKINTIGQISLSIDDSIMGFAIHSMWGHYAECGEGCCIVLDRNKLIKQCDHIGLIYRKVDYNEACDNIVIPQNEDITSYLYNNSKELFFHKSKDWESEQEFRIINLDVDNNGINGISIDNCIKAVIFHTNCKKSIFDCALKRKYLDILKLNNIQALEYVYSTMWSKDNIGPMLLNESRHDYLNDAINIDIEV